MDYKEYFKGKKITVMGLGLLGRGVGDIAFLAECGADLIVTDLKTKHELAKSLEELNPIKEQSSHGAGSITYVLGEHRLEDFRDRDMILKAAGVPLDSPYIAEARKNNIRVEMSTALFARLTEATIVGITGTRGKSTTTHLLYEVLRKCPSPRPEGTRGAALGIKKPEVFLGGNVRGVATLPFLATAKRGDIVVLELDSWQLQGFGEDKISPHISIFTNFLDDHLNYYKGDRDKYLDDKANIFKFQTASDTLVLGPDVAEIVFANYKDIQSKTIVAHATHTPMDWNALIPGMHNRQNIALVIEAARALGVPLDTIKEVVESFKGIPGRLELVRELNGVKFYNDTTATTPDALCAALEALGDGRTNIVLIMGGADKNLDMTKALDVIPTCVKKVILLPGTGTDKLVEENKNFIEKVKPVFAKHITEAIEQAVGFAEKGDSILMSPGFASFGPPPGGFKNEFDRGDQFTEAVKKLI